VPVDRTQGALRSNQASPLRGSFAYRQTRCQRQVILSQPISATDLEQFGRAFTMTVESLELRVAPIPPRAVDGLRGSLSCGICR